MIWLLVPAIWMVCIVANALLLGWMSGHNAIPDPFIDEDAIFIIVFLSPLLLPLSVFCALYVKTQSAARP